MINIDKIPLDIVRKICGNHPATYPDIVRHLKIKNSQESIQLFQIIKYIHTEVVVNLLVELGLEAAANSIREKYIAISDFSKSYVDISGLDDDMNLRNIFIKQVVKDNLVKLTSTVS